MNPRISGTRVTPTNNKTNSRIIQEALLPTDDRFVETDRPPDTGVRWYGVG
jgi:hypothetical protein